MGSLYLVIIYLSLSEKLFVFLIPQPCTSGCSSTYTLHQLGCVGVCVCVCGGGGGGGGGGADDQTPEVNIVKKIYIYIVKYVF